MADTAAISVVTSGILGLGGLLFGLWNAKEERASRALDREFARKVAREERVETRRAEVYVDMLADLERRVYTFERIFPAIDDMLPPPDPLSDDDWIRLKARTVAFGSPEVVSLVEEFSRVSYDFTQAWTACRALDQAGARPGDDFAASFAKLSAARAELRQKSLPTIERRVRDELS